MKRYVGKTLIYIVLIFWLLVTLFPFVWVVNNSFKVSGLVISDSFSPAWNTIYRTDRNDVIVRETVMMDDYGREMYDKLLFDAEGNPVYEKDVETPTLTDNNPLAGLMGVRQPEAEAVEGLSEQQAYDTKNGSRVYDPDSRPIKQTPTWTNYVEAFTNPNVNILRGYRNSLVVSGTVMLTVMLMSSMMAFGLTRFTFRGRKTINSLVVAALMFPSFSTIVPVYRMIANMGMFDTLQGVILVQMAGNLAFACTVMMGFVRGLPFELEEASFLEGCGAIKTFFKIVLPMMRPALATVCIFTFIWSYNDLFVQMVFLRSKSLMPVCAILREISSQFGTDFGLMTAAVTIVVLPVLVVYILLQKNIIKGMTAGAVKG